MGGNGPSLEALNMQRSRRKRLRRFRNLALLSLLLILAVLLILPSIPTSEGNVIVLTMVYGSEKRGWIEAVTPLFQEWWSEHHPNRTLEIHFIALGSRESMNQIILGEIKPVIWSPASSVWIPLANYMWREEYGSKRVLVESWRPLVASPVVIATWERYAEEHNITGWDSVHRLAISPDSDLKFAHTDPQLSNSGFMALLMEVSAAAGCPTQNLTYEDLLREDVRLWLRGIEGRSVMYGESTGFLADQATSSGPSGLNVFIAYENLIIEKNRQGEPMARWGQRLVAVYPEEGILMSDHPFCILNAPWVSEEQREAAEEFYNFLVLPEIQRIAMEHGFRPVNPEVDLDPEIFSVENGVSAEIPSPILEAPEDGRVLQSITDLWLISRPGG
ncbi:substrate-binding domain-containing protein [Candidatus Bathyarchaeota archaeon]|nr:substrate-binding domain-containing protein [Candidatus Bathyarchaeota archaeon]